MSGFREARDRLARQAKIEKLDVPLRETGHGKGFDISDVLPSVGDAIADKYYTADAFKEFPSQRTLGEKA